VDARRRKFTDEVEQHRLTAKSVADKEALDGAELALARASRLLRPRVKWWPWWHTGDGRDAWAAIHDAEESLQTVRDLPSQVREATEHAHRDLPPAVAAAEIAKVLGEDDPTKQAAAASDLLEASHAASSRQLADLFSATRLLWTLTIAATVAILAAILAQALVAAPFLPAPRLSNGSRVSASPSVLLALVAGCGATGGLLRAASEILRRHQPEVRWFSPRPARGAFMVVAGAWFGVVGALALASGFIVAEYTSMAAVLLIAIAFGYSQKAVTSFLDRQVGSATNAQADSATRPSGNPP
jgi:hypothetical protein